MRDLDTTLAYDLRHLSDEQLNELVDRLSTMNSAGIFQHKDFDKIRKLIKTNHKLNTNLNFECWGLYTTHYFNRKLVNALTLFETKFKQGDKVLVRDYEVWDWIEKVYGVEHNGRHYVESYNEAELLSYNFIKPYELQKKWYVVGRGVDAYYSVLSEDEVLWSRAEDKRVEEITDSEFIKHLDANAN